MISAAIFKKHITKPLGERMRSLGFKGSGFNYLMDTEHFVFAFGIQASQYGGRCCAEYGIQPKEVDTNGHNKIDFNKLKFAECELRERLQKRATQWWTYSDSEDNNIRIAQEIYDLFVFQAMPTISAFKMNPKILDSIQINDLDNCHVNVRDKLKGIAPPFGAPRFAWVMMKYHEKKNLEKAIEFAKYRLATLEPDSIFFAKPDFENILRH
jgi:hypothetical protein